MDLIKTLSASTAKLPEGLAPSAATAVATLVDEGNISAAAKATVQMVDMGLVGKAAEANKVLADTNRVDVCAKVALEAIRQGHSAQTVSLCRIAVKARRVLFALHWLACACMACNGPVIPCMAAWLILTSECIGTSN